MVPKKPPPPQKGSSSTLLCAWSPLISAALSQMKKAMHQDMCSTSHLPLSLRHLSKDFLFLGRRLEHRRHPQRQLQDNAMANSAFDTAAITGMPMVEVSMSFKFVVPAMQLPATEAFLDPAQSYTAANPGSALQV